MTPPLEQLKEDFISLVNHELRTPLTSIHGSLQLLASGQLATQPEKRDRLIQIAAQNSDRLVRLMNHILDFKRLKSGSILKQPQLIPALMSQAVTQVQDTADQAGVRIAMQPLQAILYSDGDRIVQVLVQLLQNAIKCSTYTGVVALTATKQDDDIVFTVRDRGCGIPEGQLHQVFEPFHQIDTHDDRRTEGIGLGLAICQQIVQQHGGKIWVESQLGQGSCFFFTIPHPSTQGQTDEMHSDYR